MSKILKYSLWLIGKVKRMVEVEGIPYDGPACLAAQSLKSCMTPWMIAHHAPLVHGIFPERIPEWVAMPSSWRSSRPRDWTQVSCASCIAGGFFATGWWQLSVNFLSKAVWAFRTMSPQWNVIVISVVWWASWGPEVVSRGQTFQQLIEKALY